MTYSVQNSDGSLTINVAASQVNSSFSVALVGRNVSGYGQYFVQNSIRHLENFASSSAPSPDIKLTGQSWYDKGEKVMRVYDGSGWQRMSATVSATAPSGGVAAGTQYFDTKDDKLKVYDGSAFVDSSYAGKVTNEYSGDSSIGSPQKYGTRLRTAYVPDNTGAYKAVLALMYVSDGSSGTGVTNGETIMAIFSDHDEFTVSSSLNVNFEGLGSANVYAELNDTTNGIGTTIKPGMNLRKKYATTAVALAANANVAATANAIYNGTSNINGANVFTTSSNQLVPDTALTDQVDIGSATNRYNDLYIGSVISGNNSSNVTQYIKKAGANAILDIGEAGAPINNMYVDNLTASNISGLNIESFGNATNDIDFIYASNIVASNTIVSSTGGIKGNVLSSANVVLIDHVAGTSNLSLNGNVIAGTGLSAAAQYDGTSDVTFSIDSTVVTETSTDTLSNKTFGSTVKASADNTIDIGETGTKFATVHATTFSGVATSAQYADMAEIYSSDVEYEPGTVVKIGGEKEITQTLEHADIEVFGVISSNPAYLMNSEANGQPVALAGRVPVKVVGKVAKGERLVASDVPGVAWGVADEDVDVKAIIGRSLEDKEDGDEGMIEAVIGVK
tara:strand:- start:129 stop:1985 length:1857 start_codon:yes stop_codon:yes gene_type:complete